ncbi:hypothetical protein DB345_02320 [Spartobacteria bacterium LR76]|nr:hypothetical protein DB345_02320 [Spartobacteria bacterium LR76]
MSVDPQKEIRQISIGVRTLAVVFIVVLDYLNLRLALMINSFGRIFNDMLGGKPLPALTQFIVANELLFVTLALAFLAGAVCIAIFVRNHLIALLSLSAILLVIGVQLILTLSGLYAPLQQTVAGLSGG